MDDLDKKKCVPCEGGLEPLSEDQSKTFLSKLEKGWILDKNYKYIEKSFTKKNHYELSSFLNIVIHISHTEDHHPEITFGYNTAKIRYFTYAINGLSENDFICAAKIDKLSSI